MARIERTEYETVERSVEVTVCDCCGVETDKTVQLSLNPEEKRETTYEITELEEHPEDLELYDEVEYRWGEVGRVCKNVEYDLYEGPWDPHWATKKNETTTLVGATETFDVCIGCLREVFGADIPEEYESVEIDSEGLAVTVERETLNPLLDDRSVGVVKSTGFIATLLTLPVSSWYVYPRYHEDRWSTLECTTFERMGVWLMLTFLWVMVAGVLLNITTSVVL